MKPLPVLEAATRVSRMYETLSNVNRVLILIYLAERHERSWSEIKRFLESCSGPVNPNTLHFHLKALTEASFIRRVGSEDKPTYEIDRLPGEITDTIKKVIRETGKPIAGGS